MEFVKAHGTGNDFVLLPDLHDSFVLTEALVVAICAPHTGLGADGVIRIGAPRAPADDVFMDYRNADGSLSEMCGNGVRCVAKYVVDRGLVAAEQLRVDTRDGTKVVDVLDRDADGRLLVARVDMGVPAPGKVDWEVSLPQPVSGVGDTVRLTTLSMGNPHAVHVTDDVDGWPLADVGRQLQSHPAFPEGVNLEVVTVVDRHRVRGRIFERGVGETRSSGTGSSAMAVAAVLLGLTEPRVQVAVPGGRLDVDWSGERLLIAGPAVEVAHGTLDGAWLQTIR
jgi:diaminopimelate epimerase